MDLVCLEIAGTKRSETVEGRVVLREEASLRANGVQEWPFQILVPDVLLPSSSTDKTSVMWRVKGILVRSRRTDFTIEQVIQMYTEPLSS